MLDEVLALVEQERVQEQQRIIRTELEDEIGREYELEVEQIESELIAIQQCFEAEDAEMLDEALAIVEEARMLQREAELEFEIGIVDEIIRQNCTPKAPRVEVGWQPTRDGSFRELISFAGLQQSRKVTPRETNNDEEHSESESTQSSLDLLEESQEQTTTDESEQLQQLRYLRQQMEAERAERANQERIAEELRQQMEIEQAHQENRLQEQARRIAELEQYIPRERNGREVLDQMIRNKRTFSGLRPQSDWIKLRREMERENRKKGAKKYRQEVLNYCSRSPKTQSDEQQDRIYSILDNSLDKVNANFDGLELVTLLEEVFTWNIREKVEGLMDFKIDYKSGQTENGNYSVRAYKKGTSDLYKGDDRSRCAIRFGKCQVRFFLYGYILSLYWSRREELLMNEVVANEMREQEIEWFVQYKYNIKSELSGSHLDDDRTGCNPRLLAPEKLNEQNQPRSSCCACRCRCHLKTGRDGNPIGLARCQKRCDNRKCTVCRPHQLVVVPGKRMITFQRPARRAPKIEQIVDCIQEPYCFAIKNVLLANKQ
jgi:hypothetical protein